MKKIGFFTSFGIGGADHTSYILAKQLSKHYGNEKFTVFFNNMSLPNSNNLSRHDSYLEYCKPIKISSVTDFNNYNIDILFVHRGGNEFWLLPDFENTNFNFKIIEINFHGATLTKADFRIFPSQTLVNHYSLNNVPHIVIPNPIPRATTLENLREELNLNNKFVVGRVARGDPEIYCDINLIAYKNIEDENTVFLYLNPSHKAIEDSKKLNIKNIIFIKPTICSEQLDKLYNTFDVHAHSNVIGETFGNSVAESFIRGIPTISHEGLTIWPQAHKEFFINTKELYINKSDKNTMVAIYTKCLYMLKNNLGYRDYISKLQKEYAVKHFSEDVIVNRYIEVIDNI
tara:strand:- start:6293 stop:7324 length:1032 start_codon:yes stop_codon:yes gene_type:complete